WQVGHRIRTEVLRNRRAEYGEQILPTLSANLLAGRSPDTNRGAEEQARRIRRTDSADTVGKIGPRVRPGVQRAESGPDGSFCGGVSRQRDCLDIVETVGLEPLR